MPDTLELTEETTKEELQAVVDQLAADRAPDAEDEEKSDAQITSEHADTEQPSDTEDTADEPVGETTGEEEKKADSDWLTKDLRAEAAALGIDKKELAEFTSREELERAFKILNRNLDDDRKKVAAERKKENVKPDEKPAEAEKASSDGYKVDLDKNVYDDKIVEEFDRLSKHYESRLAELEQRLGERDAAAQEERFDRSVDALTFAELFGKTGEESDTEMDRRKELFEHVQIEEEVLKRRGRAVTDYNALVERVARSIFPEQYEKKTIKNHTRKISRQSDKRQGGGATRPTDPPEDPREFADRLFKEMAGA